jgi:hypothetical protein
MVTYIRVEKYKSYDVPNISKIETCLENSLFENDNIYFFIRKFTV